MLNGDLFVLNTIISYGYEASIVGGFARDKYIGIESRDVDICTNATPKQLKDIFKDGMLPKEQYGSVAIIYKKVRYDITTYRKDIKYENNRLPVEIEYINSFEEDLPRRAFIINTLCIDSNGTYIYIFVAYAYIVNMLINTVGKP